MYYEVIPTEMFRSGGGVLTYMSDVPLLIGQVVQIPLGRKTTLGIVWKKVPKVDFPTKPIQRIICPFPLPKHLLKSIFWLSEYYLTSIPMVANLIIPAGLASRNALKSYLEPPEDISNQNRSNTALTPETTPKTASRKPKNTKTLASQAKTPSLSQPQTDSGTQTLAKSAVQPKPQSATQAKTLSLPTTQTPALSSATSTTENIVATPEIPLNPAQLQALADLKSSPSSTRLLRGITGSGKTNIYLQLTAETLQNHQSAILLVPEIALTSQLVQIFEQTFQNHVTLIHSQQTMTERRKTWLNIITNPEQPRVIIGPRSALLAPLHNLGLILIDEAHESAYYQENPPRYSALRLASFIASTLKIPCILGTATPNIVDYHIAQTRNSLIELQQKAKTTALKAKTTVIDLKQRDLFLKNRYFSSPLLTAIEKNIKDKHQTLIFHNRRGSAPLTVCENCGWQALCPECFLPMTLHTDTYTLNCHICGYSEKVPSTCPECKHVGIIHKGFGTKLLESELTKLFPDAKIARFDGDNKKDDDLASLYDTVKSGEIDILIGTQTLARGLDLPHLATVGIVQADAGLALPDFAAEERTFELLTQVIGRVGRGHIDKAEVFIQSYQPDHPVIQSAITSDYNIFSKYLLQRRREQQMPPFTYLARLSITYKTERTTLTKIQQAHTALKNLPNITVSPPTPAFHERTNRGFTWQLIVKSPSRTALRKALLPYTGNSQYTVVLDPPSLL